MAYDMVHGPKFKAHLVLKDVRVLAAASSTTVGVGADTVHGGYMEDFGRRTQGSPNTP